jgi:hypothetical protein
MIAADAENFLRARAWLLVELVSSHLARELVETSWCVVVLDGFSSEKTENVSGLVDSDGLTVVRENVREVTLLSRFLGQIVVQDSGLTVWQNVCGGSFQ